MDKPTPLWVLVERFHTGSWYPQVPLPLVDYLQVIAIYKADDMLGLDVIRIGEDQKDHPLYRKALVRVLSRIGSQSEVGSAAVQELRAG